MSYAISLPELLILWVVEPKVAAPQTAGDTQLRGYDLLGVQFDETGRGQYIASTFEGVILTFDELISATRAQVVCIKTGDSIDRMEFEAQIERATHAVLAGPVA